MRVARFSRCAALPAALALMLAACSKPTVPRVHAITGHVTLIGFLVQSDSVGTARFAGTRVVGDADGVPVELLYGTDVVARTVTAKGVYHFTGIAAGGYRARTTVGSWSDTTSTLTVTDHDLAAADTLTLVARGNLFPVPNPIQSGMRLVYPLSDNALVDISIEDLGGAPIRTIVSNVTLPAGTRMADWDGNDASGHPVAPGMYWLLFHAEYQPTPELSEDRIALLFR